MTRPRLLEIDLLRTLAICMMVGYHAAFDLDAFFGVPLPLNSMPWWLFARSTAVLFLLLSGLTFELTRHGSRSRKWRRIGILWMCAALVSATTYVWDAESFVRFGILHCIAASLTLLQILPGTPLTRGMLAACIVALAIPLRELTAETSWLLPLGMMPRGFRSLDYFPLVPWFGVVLAGAALSPLLLSRMHTYTAEAHPVLRAFALPGRHALLLYMVHQPLLLGILTAALP